MSSLTDLLMSRLGGTEIEKLSRRLGADRDTTGNAVKAAIPMLMAALARNVGSDQGRAALAGALDRDHDGSILDDVGSFFGSGSSGDGEAILKHVFGSRRPVAAKGLGHASGLDAHKAGKVLAMLAPLVLGALGRTKREKHLDAGDLAGMLAGEGGRHRESLGGLAGLLDRDGDGQVADDVLEGLAKGFGSRFFGR